MKTRIAIAAASAVALTVGQRHTGVGMLLREGDRHHHPSGGPWSCACTSDCTACFAEHGDWFRVEDWKTDGNSAVAVWQLTIPTPASSSAKAKSG